MSTRDHWYEALRDLALRNAAVQVTPLAGAAESADAEALAAACQTRLLVVGDDESLTVELPPVPEQALALRRAVSVDVLAISGGQRWIGRCPKLKEVRHRLNERTGVLALHLGPAAQIHSGQRRNFFRVDAADEARLPVRLALAEPDAGEPVAALKAWLENLSGGGMGLRMDKRPADDRAIAPGRMYLCQFQLPGDEMPIAVRAHLIHARPTRDRALYLGLAFHFTSDHEQRRVQEQIVRFTTTLERKRLQRRRSA